MTPHCPYFPNNQPRIDALLAQLAAWEGTRWRHAGARPNDMRCGISGDCLFWVHAFKAIGALPAKLEIPDYRLHEASADEMQTLRRCIEATGRALLTWARPGSASVPLAVVPKMASGTLALQNFAIGDVLLFKNGTSGAHCGLAVKESPLHFVHLTGNGLLEEPFHQSHYIAALAYVYRLLEDA